MASPFKGLDKTKPSGDYDYVRDGVYLCRVDEFRFGQNRSNVGYARFGFTVVNVIDASSAVANPKGPHRVGEKISWVLRADKDASAPNLKAALMAIANCPAEEITDEASEMLASEAQPLAGLFVVVEARTVKKQKSEGFFTRVSIKRRVSGAEVKTLTPPEVLKSLGLKDLKDED